MSATLLQRYSFNGTLTGEGSLNLALQNTATTLGTPSYTTGPVAGTQALIVPITKYLTLPYNSSLDFTGSSIFSFGGYFFVEASGALYEQQLMNNLSPIANLGIETYAWSYGTHTACWVNKVNKGDCNISPTLIGRWVHYWVTYNGTNIIQYADGTQIGSVALNGTFSSSSFWNLCDAPIPTSSTAASTGGTYRIADIRWYSGVLSPSVAMTPIGATTIYTMSFNGTSQYGRLTSSSFTTGDPFTFECWIYNSHTTMNYDSIVDLSNSTSGIDLMQMYIYPANNIFVANDVNGFGTNFSPVPLNGWVHVAATQDTTGLFALYINGMAAGTSTKNPIAVKARAVVLWGQSYHFLNLFQGYMTELRIWSVVRTAAQIATNYNRGLTGTETGLQLYIDSNAIKNCSGTGLIADKTGTYSMQMQAFSTAQITPTTALQLSALTTPNITPKSYNFNFNFSQVKPVYANIGIGTNNPIKTLDINGDINISKNIYNNSSNAIFLWNKNSNLDTYFNSNNSIGNIGIGKTNPVYLLDVNGDIKAQTFIDFSDMILKENIIDENLGLEFINTLQPKTFKYIDTTDDKLKHGLIAQDLVENGYSNFVGTDDIGYLSLQITSLIGPMVNSIKELSDKNVILKNKIESYKSNL
jgi:hypothetical protein